MTSIDPCVYTAEIEWGKDIDPCLYRAAIGWGKDIDTSTLEAHLYHLSDRKNPLLHLAAAAGNVDFVNKLLLHPMFKTELAMAKNVHDNTALHEAAKGGHKEVVDALLIRHKELAAICNGLDQTALFKACEGGHKPTVNSLVVAEPSTLDIKSRHSDGGRTVLHVAAIRGDKELLEFLLKSAVGKKDLVEAGDKDGNTVLHWAVKRNRVDMVKLLLKSYPELCSGLCFLRNKKEETPLCMAVRLGCFDVVKKLIKRRPESIEIRSDYDNNVLHLAVEFRRFEIVKFLIEKADLPEVVLSQLINQPGGEGTYKCEETKDKEGTKDNKCEGTKDKEGTKDNKCEGTKDKEGTKDNEPNLLEGGGNTPLHIAANDKNVDMVELLLKVSGVNKGLLNNSGFTPLDIAREKTEYHESFHIIEKLVDFPKRSRPFLYNAPTVSSKKHKNALENLEKAFCDRRNVELVVSVLLATMAFTAAFSVPGSVRTDGSPHKVLGSPILLGYHSFKVFLIFDCVAFFLSLFVALLWTISTPLTTDDPMLFMCLTATVLCFAFGFMALSFMLAVYAEVAHMVPTLAWAILGCSILICLGGYLACLYTLVKVLVRRARFHRLCGVPRWLDNKVEKNWTRAEKCGFLYILRCFRDKCKVLLTGTGRKKGGIKNSAAKLDGHVAHYLSPCCSPDHSPV